MRISRMRFLLLLCLVSFSASAQKSDASRHASSITVDDLRRHLYVVAGREMEGRETATEGQRKAAQYLENQFRSIGLLPAFNGSYQMPFPVYQDSLIEASVTVNGKKFELGKDVAVPLSAAYTSTFRVGQVVFLPALSDSTAIDVDLKGKVLITMATPPGQRRIQSQTALQEAALQRGASALLLIQSNFPRTVSMRGSQYVSAYRNAVYPIVYHISENLATAIIGSGFDSLKKEESGARQFNADVVLHCRKETSELQSTNVIGYLEGTDKKDEYVIITAHYDHLGKRNDTIIYYGADDDGSGTVAILELAEAFMKARQAGKGPRRSMVFMAVSGEEKGLWGSAYYGDHPVFPLEKTTVNLNIDMIGRVDPKRKEGDSLNYIYVVGDDKLSTDLRTISEASNKKFTKLELDYKYNRPDDPERIYFRSDHYNFARRGVPIIFYFSGTHQDYHRPTDTPDKINYDLLRKRTQLIFYTAWDMANREAMLKRDLKLEVPARRAF